MVPMALPTANASFAIAKLLCARSQIARRPGTLDTILAAQARDYLEMAHAPPAVAASSNF